MAKSDRDHWDARYADAEALPNSRALPKSFVAVAELLASASSALEIACGAGLASVWLAQHGVRVTGYDVSPIAIEQSGRLATRCGVSDLCTFAVADLDSGLPAGEPVDLILCNMFRDAGLDRTLVERLRPGGMLAIAALSEVGSSPGRFRCKRGELTAAFDVLEFIDHREGDGTAWLLARKP